MSIIMMAVHIRLRRGEMLEDILASYPRLSEEEKDKIRKAVQ